MEIKTSLEWAATETALLQSLQPLKNFSHKKDAKALIDNLHKMVTKLSQYELEARRSHSHSNRRSNEQLELINREIGILEQWVFMMRLSD